MLSCDIEYNWAKDLIYGSRAFGSIQGDSKSEPATTLSFKLDFS